MKNSKWVLIATVLVCFSGCVKNHTMVYTEPQPAPVSVAPSPAAPPVVDKPPESVTTETSKTTVTGVKPSVETIKPVEKQQLVMQAQLDRLVIGVAGDAKPVEVVVSHLAELGFRCVQLGAAQYDASKERLLSGAKGEQVDLVLVLVGEAKEADKFENFYSYDAKCKGKLLDAYTDMVIASTEVQKRGKRALKQEEAAQSAVEMAAAELAAYFSDELVRKVDRGLLTVRVVLTKVRGAEDTERVRAWMLSQKGVEEVKVVSWSKKTGAAVIHIRVHPAQRENLAGYLETVPGMTLKVTGIGQGVLKAYK